MRLFRPKVAVFALCLVALLVGCGQKGPLYLPESKASPATSTPPNPPAQR